MVFSKAGRGKPFVLTVGYGYAGRDAELVRLDVAGYGGGVRWRVGPSLKRLLPGWPMRARDFSTTSAWAWGFWLQSARTEDPVCPVIAADGLYVFVVPSPKRNDLRRDGRYALHSYPPEEVDDEFYATGRATELQDPAIRAEVANAYHDEVAEGWSLFVLDLERCLHAKYRHSGDWPPTYTKWTDRKARTHRGGERG